MSTKKKDIENDVSQGFDRGVDYKSMKEKLINEYEKVNKEILEIENPKKQSQKRILINKLIYLCIACIQLRNGSRISEACCAFVKFIKNRDITNKVVVKIAKSESIKYKKSTGEKFITPRRNRYMMFPNNWIDFDFFEEVEESLKGIRFERLKKRVLDYLLKYFECNTHSLRYAFVNYMLYDLKRPMNDVGKFIGHSNLDMLIKYTQLKNTHQIFDLDI